MSASAALYLASASPRRRELLALLDYPFTVLSVDVEEQRRSEERPQDYVQRLARDKSQAGWLACRPSAAMPRQLLFTAHNPAMLDDLDLDNDEVRLFTVDRDNHGHTVVRRLELTSNLREQNREYPLSRLWMMGHLGAVPNV